MGGPSAMPQDMRLNFVTQSKKLDVCLEAPETRAPPTKIKLLYRIGSDGKLSQARFAKQALLPQTVIQCINKQLKTWSWPKPKGKYDGAVTFAVAWQPKKEAGPPPTKSAVKTATAKPMPPHKTPKQMQGTLTLSRQPLSPVLPDSITKVLEREFKDYQLPAWPQKHLAAKGLSGKENTPPSPPMPFYWYLYADIAGTQEPDFTVFLKHKTKPHLWQIVSLVQSRDEGYQQHVVITEEEFKLEAPEVSQQFEGIFLGPPPCDETLNPSFYLLAQDGTKVSFQWTRKWFEKTIATIYE